MPALHDRLAMDAHHRHLDRRLDDGAVGKLIVESARKNARRRGLADPAHAREDPGLRNAARLECIRKRAHHRILTDQILKGRGPILAREHAIGPGLIGAVAHNAIWSAARRHVFALRMRERWEADERPEPRSLGLLPSGPDPVGEWLVHRQPPVPISAQRNENASGGEAWSTARLEPISAAWETCRDRGFALVPSCALMRLRCERANGTAPAAQVSRRSYSMSPRPDLGPKPRLGFAASSIERATERRPDAAALAALEKERHARTYLVAGDQVILKSATAVADPLFALPEARALGRTTEIVFLGLCRNAPRFAIGL